MKKLFFVLLTVLLLGSCSVSVIGGINETEESYGYTYDWISKYGSEYIIYTLIVSDSPLYGNSHFFISHFDSSSLQKATKVEDIENPKIGAIVRKNGKIESITVEGKKYVDLKVKSAP